MSIRFHIPSLPIAQKVGLGLLLLFLIPSHRGAFAQKESLSRQHRKLLKEGAELVRVGEYLYALPHLEKLDSLAPNNPDCGYLLGLAYFHTESFEKANKYLVSSYSPEKVEVEHLFYLGRSYHILHQFDSAIAFYQKTKALEKSIQGQQELGKLLQQCENGKKLIAKPKNIEKFNLGTMVNSPYPDFAPALSADETKLFFTSRRPNQQHAALDPEDNLPYEDIYMAERKKNGTWGKPQNLTAINTEEHDASIGLSPDGNTLFIYRGQKAVAGFASGNIYHTTYQDGAWSEPQSMQKGINSRAQETHAAIMEDEMMLFIASSRENAHSLGGKDIYLVRRLPDQSWAEPENLGSIINGPYDEDSPYITADGKTLYFSSNGANSMGGYDIFYTHFDDKTGQWTAPTNMGYPVNTAADDIFIVWSADGTRGYFSSKKEDTHGDQDLYMILLPEEERQLIALKGKVTDDQTGEPVAAIIEIVDNSTHEIVKTTQSNAFDGRFAIFLPTDKNYGVRVSKDGYLFHSINVHVPNQFEYLEIKQDFQIKRMGHNQVGVLNNVFFKEGAEILENSYPELLALKNLVEAHPDYQFEIAVHGGGLEDSLLNLMLTRARAEAVAYQLTKLGVNDDGLLSHSHGFGNQFPLAANGTRLGKMKNNRVEYIVRKKNQATDSLNYGLLYAKMEISIHQEVEEEAVSYEVDKKLLSEQQIAFDSRANILDDAAESAIQEIIKIMDRYPDMQVEVAGFGGKDGSEAFREALALQLASLVAQKLAYGGIDPERIVIEGDNSGKNDRDGNKKIRVAFRALEEGLETSLPPDGNDQSMEPQVGEYLSFVVYFEQDSYLINAEGQEALKGVEEVMQVYPHVKLQVEGHSDPTGAAAYNLILSEKRANKIMKALQQMGVMPERLQIKAYGESKEHQVHGEGVEKRHNRRCIFKVVE